MKKKTYKRLINRIGREKKKYLQENLARLGAERERAAAKREAEWYRHRFREIGSRVETIDPGPGKIKMLKWTVSPEQLGNYIRVLQDDSIYGNIEEYIFDLAESIAKGIIDNNLLQIIVKEADDGPLDRYGTIAAKLYVVPWEQMTDRKQIEVVRKVEGLKL